MVMMMLTCSHYRHYFWQDCYYDDLNLSDPWKMEVVQSFEPKKQPYFFSCYTVIVFDSASNKNGGSLFL